MAIDLRSPRQLARALTIVENQLPGWKDILYALPPSHAPIIGITGPPGAGKSTLTDALIALWVGQGMRIGVMAIDPSSPFHLGALLGDRIRLSQHFLTDKVFIRSLSARGSLGGLSAKAIELADVMRAAGFDFVLIETVGVGQSEIDIAGLADVTVLVTVPESGDEVQTLKSGIMEIADLFAVNKADRPGASAYAAALRTMLHARAATAPLVHQVTAATGDGVPGLAQAIAAQISSPKDDWRKAWLLAQRAWQIVAAGKMEGITIESIHSQIKEAIKTPDFQFYQFIQKNFFGANGV